MDISDVQVDQPRNLEYRKVGPAHKGCFERLVEIGSLTSFEIKNPTFTGKADYRLVFPDGTVLYLYHSEYNGGHKLVPAKVEKVVADPEPKVQDNPILSQEPEQIEQLVTKTKSPRTTKKFKAMEVQVVEEADLPSWMKDDEDSNEGKKEQ